MKRPKILISTSNANSSDLINITGDSEIIYSDRATSNAVIKAGGLPFYAPSTENIQDSELESYLDIADGLLLTGADTNTNPIYYGELPTHLKGRIDDERDKVDIKLVKSAYKRKLPMLVICKGMQIANVALGGTLYQNIVSQCSKCFDHDIKKTNRSNFTHMVKLTNGSILKRIFNKDMIHVNGGHQQAVKDLSEKLKAVAVAEDRIIEAYEGISHPFLLGLQFHAELRLFDPQFFEIFKMFIKHCNK